MADTMFNFSDPNTMAMLGLIGGLGASSAPSPVPVPMGLVVGKGIRGMIDGAQAGMQDRLATQQAATGKLGLIQQASDANFGRGLIHQAPITGADLYGATGNTDISAPTPDDLQRLFLNSLAARGGQMASGGQPATATDASSGGAPTGVPSPAQAAPGVDTSQPGWFMRPGAIGAQASPGSPSASPAAAMGFGNAPGAPGGQGGGEQNTFLGATLPPGWTPQTFFLQRSKYGLGPKVTDEILTKYNSPTSYAMAKHYADMHPNDPQAALAAAHEAGAPTGYTTDASGKLAVDPGYVAGQGAITGAQKWAGVAPDLYFDANKIHEISRPGATLVKNGHAIAQVPVPLDSVGPDGTPQREYRYLPVVPFSMAPQVSGAGSAASPQPQPGPLPRTVTQGVSNPTVKPSSTAGMPFPTSVGAAPAAPSSAGVNDQGLPRVSTGLNPMQHAAATKRGTELEDYGSQLQNDAAGATQGNFLVDQLRRESQSWSMGKFADIEGDARAYLQGFRQLFNLPADPSLDQKLGDFQAFRKNGMELTRQAVRATSSRAAFQEMQMIQSALPQPMMSDNGFGQIADQLQGVNDYKVVKARASDAWRARPGGDGTLAGFESNWNQNITPAAFLVHRMSPQDWQATAANLQKTPTGRAYLSRVVSELQYGQRAGLFQDGG